MQRGTEQLKRQQQILTALGYYDGQIDGIWSDRTIEAKQKWENSGRFIPAIPNNGMPFGDVGKYPSGIRRETSGLLTCYEFEKWVEEQVSVTTKIVQHAKSTSVKPETDSGDAEE